MRGFKRRERRQRKREKSTFEPVQKYHHNESDKFVHFAGSPVRDGLDSK